MKGKKVKKHVHMAVFSIGGSKLNHRHRKHIHTHTAHQHGTDSADFAEEEDALGLRAVEGDALALARSQL